MPIPFQEPRMTGRFFDDLDEVYDWAVSKAEDAGNRSGNLGIILQEGGAKLKNAGGKNNAMQDRQNFIGQKFAYEDMARAIEEISPHRKLKDATEDEILSICTRCGLDLPRPMVPEPPALCGFDNTVMDELHDQSPSLVLRDFVCSKTAEFKIVAPHAEFFGCTEHLDLMIKLADQTKNDGRSVFVEVIR